MVDAPRCYTGEAECAVCSALHRRCLKIDNTHCNQELLCEVWFLNDDNAVKLGKDEENHSLLVCSFRATQLVTELSRSFESGLLIRCWISI
jgi:hypothetical protein